MTMPPDHDLDAVARRVHAQALQALSPQVQAQLARHRREARSPGPARPSRAPWAWASAAATACVLVVALQLRPPVDRPVEPVTDRAAPLASAAQLPPDPVGVLADDPDFYLWLASSESQAYALE